MKKIFLSLLAFSIANGVFSQRLGVNTATPQETLDVNGNIFLSQRLGINITNPQFPLSFPNTVGDKISFWGITGNHYGIGIQGYLLQIHSAASSDDIAFGWGQSAAFNEVMRIKGSGNVGIGTASPSQKLHVAGNICATGTIGACSDIRYKKDFTSIRKPLQSILSLNGFYYNWKRGEFPGMHFTSNRQLGFSAQQVEKLFPEVVMTDDNGYKSVDYGRLTPVLVEAMKEQQQQINTLQEQIDELKKIVKKLN